MLDETQLELLMDEQCHNFMSCEMLKLIDTKIICVLSKARKFVEGPKRNVPYSVTKVKARARLLYWKARYKLLKGARVDVEIMEKRKEEAGIETNENLSLQAISNFINDANAELKK